MINPQQMTYPAPKLTSPTYHGLYPIDFVLETIIRVGLEWFRTTPEAPKLVYGHLMAPWLAEKYGEAKIQEIAAFIAKYKIEVVQHWAQIPQVLPCFSIQLLDGSEDLQKVGMADFARTADVLNMENAIVGRSEVGYEPMLDNIHIGIHTESTPDLAKYLYYLLIYILNAFKVQLEARGLQLGTFRATDLSKLQEYLPNTVYSRFVNFTCLSISTYDKGGVPIIEKILGVHVPEGSDATSDNVVDPTKGLLLNEEDGNG